MSETPAFSIKGKGGMLMTALPATFGHCPPNVPLLFGSVRDAEAVRRALPTESRGYTCIVVVEWTERETIGHSEGSAT